MYTLKDKVLKMDWVSDLWLFLGHKLYSSIFPDI
jgi:hypothetical protein